MCGQIGDIRAQLDVDVVKDILAERSINIFECDQDENDEGVMVADWEDIAFEVALDSGSIVHVCSDTDAPGYDVRESAGSKRGQNFTVGNGGKMANMGEFDLNLATSAGLQVKSTFQVAKVTRPLMSVGRMCDEGHTVHFDKTKAVVKNSSGVEIARFERRGGGLYTCKMVIKAPFVRQE